MSHATTCRKPRLPALCAAVPAKVRTLLVAALVVVAILCGYALSRPRAPAGPLEISYWYWNTPFHIRPADTAVLRSMGVRQLFVRAGTLSRAATSLRLTIPQVWRRTDLRLPIHLVFTLDGPAARSFGSLSVPAACGAIEAAAERERSAAAQAGLTTRGVQIDCDCPTRRLGHYADLLDALRLWAHARRLELSITALPTWLSSTSVDRLFHTVDFAVPQYYEGDTPASLAQLSPISRIARMQRDFEALARIGAPVYIGIPAYGHALVFDEQGALTGLYHDEQPEEAMRDPLFRLTDWYPSNAAGAPATAQNYIGEDIYRFVVTRPVSAGGRAGLYHLVYDLPAQRLLAQHIEAVRADRPACCRGVILFRYPQPGETMTVPLATAAAVWRGETPGPKLVAKLRRTADPWSVVDSGGGVPERSVSLEITNTGDAPTAFGPNAVTCSLRFDRPGIVSVDEGGWLGYTSSFAAGALRPSHAAKDVSMPPAPAASLTASLAASLAVNPPESLAAHQQASLAAILPAGGPTNPAASPPASLSASLSASLAASLPRSNTLCASLLWLPPGATARFGPIEFDPAGPSHVSVEWTARLPGGFDTLRGALENASLSSVAEEAR